MSLFTSIKNLLAPKTKKPYKIGLVLGGGGARGFAHLGVLQALGEKGIHPDVISGVSAGAIVGSLIAVGKSPIEVMQLMSNHKLFDFTSLIIPKKGLLGFDKLEVFLQNELSADTFEDLKIPFYAAVSNLSKGCVEYCNQGSLSQTVLASASIPILFSPIIMDGQYYVDGGLFDNMPVKPLLGKCEKLIGVGISPVQEIEEFTNIIQIAARTFQLNDKSNTKKNIQKCDVYIEPSELCDFDLLDTSNAQKLFDIGYEYTKKMQIAL